MEQTVTKWGEGSQEGGGRREEEGEEKNQRRGERGVRRGRERGKSDGRKRICREISRMLLLPEDGFELLQLRSIGRRRLRASVLLHKHGDSSGEELWRRMRELVPAGGWDECWC